MGDTVVKVGLSADEFALSQTTEQFVNLSYKIERIDAHDTDYVIPYVWIDGPNVADVEEILETDESVDNVELLAENEA